VHLSDITTAVESAANLTRQLLAFSRQQVINPKILSLNTVVDRVRKMLERLIGEDVKVVTNLAPNLRRVRIDVGQAEQILLNLSVNARDAMPDGGTLTIETANIELDEEYCSKHAHASAGSYVMLSISDNGTGMTQETKNNLFVPFFTTKEHGRGTGLGLSIVYGAVRQNDGFIDVYSELDLGTTLKIYLPCVDASIESVQPQPLFRTPSGRETILLVEDDSMVRSVAYRALVGHGYRVHAYPSGEVALAETPQLIDGFDLIVTDVIMPGINGRMLVEKLRETYGDLKALYTSGYTENVISYHGLLSENVDFLAKPYSIGTLVQCVRSLLDRKKQ
jgi:CheY-like chemotaxis protein